MGLKDPIWKIVEKDYKKINIYPIKNKKLSKNYLKCISGKLKNKSTGLSLDTSNIKEKKTLSDWFKKKEMTFEENINSEFFELFNDHKLEYIFTGHLHINLETSFHETKIITTSALGLPLGEDPSGYRIIDYKDGELSYKFYAI